MPPKKKGGKGKGNDEEDKVKDTGKILNNELKTVLQRIGKP